MGRDVHAKDEFGKAPLHYVRTAEVAQVLLDRGADVHAKSKSGSTPLYEISYRVEVVRVLLEHGADVRAKNNSGDTSLHNAGQLEIAQLLLDRGADVHAKNNNREVPLHTAGVGVARVLLDHGADIDARDKDGRSPALLQKLISSINVHHSNLEMHYSMGFNQETLQKVLEAEESSVVEKIRLVPFLLESGATMARIENSPQGWSDIVQIVYFVHEVSKRRNDGLSISDLEIIRQWVKDVFSWVSSDNIKRAVALDKRNEVRNVDSENFTGTIGCAY